VRNKSCPVLDGTAYFWGMNMYFVALVAPDEINQKILKWKLWMKEKFGCEVALRSPAHITLLPPFWMKPELENEFIDSINSFSDKQQGFDIQLRNFNSFKPKVIFVDIVKDVTLDNIHKNLQYHLLSTEKFPVKKDERPFHPHITIATRDLYKRAFYEAMDYFKTKEYEASWRTEGISLLRHNKKNWDVIFTSQFKNI